MVAWQNDAEMSDLEKIEGEIQSLSKEELAEFRAWFAEYDWDQWDRQVEADAAAGKLDVLAEEALREHEAGQTRPF